MAIVVALNSQKRSIMPSSRCPLTDSGKFGSGSATEAQPTNALATASQKHICSTRAAAWAHRIPGYVNHSRVWLIHRWQFLLQGGVRLLPYVLCD